MYLDLLFLLNEYDSDQSLPALPECVRDYFMKTHEKLFTKYGAYTMCTQDPQLLKSWRECYGSNTEEDSDFIASLKNSFTQFCEEIPFLSEIPNCIAVPLSKKSVGEGDCVTNLLVSFCHVVDSQYRYGDAAQTTEMASGSTVTRYNRDRKTYWLNYLKGSTNPNNKTRKRVALDQLALASNPDLFCNSEVVSFRLCNNAYCYSFSHRATMSRSLQGKKTDVMNRMNCGGIAVGCAHSTSSNPCILPGVLYIDKQSGLNNKTRQGYIMQYVEEYDIYVDDVESLVY